jgi:hypothetical protein
MKKAEQIDYIVEALFANKIEDWMLEGRTVKVHRGLQSKIEDVKPIRRDYEYLVGINPNAKPRYDEDYRRLLSRIAAEMLKINPRLSPVVVAF